MLHARKSLGVLIVTALVFPVSSVFTSPAQAQSYREYCHERAQRLSGYRSGNDVIGGAARGALGGVVIGSVLGGKKGRKRGAKIGAVMGAVGSASRPNSQAARIYRLEFDDCMRRR